MLISQASGKIQIQAPAKVNLFLEVLGRRDDGYHDVETVLCPVSLFDQVSFEPTVGTEIRLDLSFPDLASETPRSSQAQGSEESCIAAALADSAWQIPANESNLVVKAVQEVRRRLGLHQGAHIQLHKRIPAAAGLGGGSSDAAAAIVASMLAWDRWDRDLALDIATQLGSDVPFYLGDPSGLGIALATGRGEKCTRLCAMPRLHFWVTHPAVGCATKAIYEHFSRNNSAKSPAAIRHSGEIVAACKAGQAEKIGAALWNTLQFSATCLNHWIETQLTMYQACGVGQTLMSGSGSSCFALVADSNLVADATLEMRIRHAAAERGIPRVYGVEAVYQPSIEQQVG